MSAARHDGFRSSFQFRLFSLFTVLTAVITVIFAALFAFADLRKSRLFAEEMLQSQAMGFAETIRLPLYAENREALGDAAHEFLLLPQMRAVEIRSADGRLLSRIPERQPSRPGDLIVKKVEVHARATLPSLSQIIEPYPAAASSLIGTVTVYRGTADLTEAARTLLCTTIGLATLFWLLVSFSCYRLLKRVTTSFSNLMDGLEKVHAGDYRARIEVLSDDEPGRASVAVNHLAESLERRELENALLNAELRAAMEVEIASREELASLNLNLEAQIEEGRRARQELKNLVEQLPVGIVWSNPQGHIEYLNGFLHERFGYRPEEIPTVEKWFRLMFPDPAYRERIARLRRSAIESWREGLTAPSSWDARAVCRDGSVRQLNLGIQLAGARVVDLVIDMTEREQLQEQIIRNQKLESLGVLAGGIAHNFNNALTGVLGFITFARQFLDPSHRSHELLCHAERASKRAAGVARQLLTFAKGGMPDRKALQVERLINEALLLATTGSKVVTSLEISPSLSTVYADEDQISQVFNCLCINAVQAMPEGGVLTVRARNVCTETESLPVPSPGDYLEISFEDQGVGISQENQGKIFTPYFTTKAEIGTGLGLATVHSIVTRHEGAVSFVSQLGSGTVFTLYLPSSAAGGEAAEEVAEQGGKEAAEAVRPAPPGACILVMDDEEVIRNLAHQVLEESGYQVTSCVDGAEAIALYREAWAAGAPYLAAILDLTVPGGVGGEEVARRILELDPGANLIVSSGHTDDPVVTAYRDHGFSARASKPYDAAELKRLLSELQPPNRRRASRRG